MTQLVRLRSPERKPELFVQDHDGKQIIVKLTDDLVRSLARDALTALLADKKN